MKTTTMTAKQYKARYAPKTGLEMEKKPRRAVDLGALVLIANKVMGSDAVSEHRFHPVRQWRLDFAWTALKVALEYEGIAGRKGSRHASLVGYTHDCEKYNEAQLLGWIVIRMTALSDTEVIIRQLADAQKARSRPCLP